MTISEKQLIANRNNCLKSTGPRTSDGKRIASRNAIRHGLLSDSAEVLLKGENQDEFESFHQNLLTNLDPQSQLEVLLAERITGFFWKLKRAGRMEKGLLDILCNPSTDSDSSAKKNSLPFVMIMTKTYDNPSKDPEYQEFKKLKEQQTVACGLDLSEGKIVDKESFDSIQALQTPEKQPSPITDNSSAQSLGKAIQQDFKSGSLLERLLRYEGQIERGLYRALTELQKFQFIRQRNDAISVGEASVLHSNVVPASQNAEKPNEAISDNSNWVAPTSDSLVGVSGSNLTDPSLLQEAVIPPVVSMAELNPLAGEESVKLEPSICHPCDLSLPMGDLSLPKGEALARLSSPKSVLHNNVVSASQDAEKPNEAISGNSNWVAPTSDSLVSVSGSNLTDPSLLHNEKPNEAILQQAEASGAQQMAADRPNADTGYFYHSPPCRSVLPQQYASHGATSLGHLSDEQLDRLSRQIV